MRQHLVAPSLWLCAAIAPLPAQKAVSKSWPLNANGAVRIMSTSDLGTIRVIGWDKDSVVVSGTLARGSAFFGGGGRDGVKMFWEPQKGFAPAKLAGVSDLTVRVPARARVWITAALADIEATTLAGQLDITAVGGHVRVKGTPSELRAETMNGDMDVSASPAYLRLKTATGHIAWTGSGEDVVLSTVSGRMIVNGGTVTRARFESIDGDIRFAGAVARSASVSFDTHGGDITLLLAKETEAELSASAPMSDLFGKRHPASKDPGQRVTSYATLGKPPIGGAEIIVRSFKGRVIAMLQ